MTEAFFYIVLSVLCIVTIINLRVLLTLHAKLKHLYRTNDNILAVEVGDLFPRFDTKPLIYHRTPAVPNHQAKVLLFLSPHCPVCAEKIPEIEAILSKAKLAGVTLNLVSAEPKWRIKRFLTSSPLLNYVLTTSRKTYNQINPKHSSPFYLFIDHNHVLQAGGTIGDDDWLSFIGQMNSYE